MSEKAVETAPARGLDSLKLGLAILVLLGGVVGFYLLDKEPLFVRIAAVLVAVGSAAVLAYATAVGRGIWQFAFDSRVEVRKMVWPTRQETVQTTLVVVLLIVVISLFLWGVDSLLAWIVRSVVG
ncbi:preprotein translocase subunit SecE [Halothiobacillus sp. DCM-1]|uniref:preprotein translocase subunit SecE n=1 Tax=Halothiobacillus sp. DCM-1 TaxID=3112558 RepID=UPI003254A699